MSVLVAEETILNPSAFSRYCSRSLVCPSPRYEAEKYFVWLTDTIKRYKCDMIFPMDDCTMQIIMDHREELLKLCRLPIPSYESYVKATDKGNAALIASEAGVECPKTYEPGSFTELEAIADDIKYPVVVKPRISSGSRGIRKAYSRDEMFSLYTEVDKYYPKPLIQEYIGSGDRFDVCLLYDMEGRLKASFVQKELRHFPLEMGPSTIQESIYYPELIEKSIAIMDRLNWRGIAELEYMMDERDGKPKFMEINSRFWASLETAIYSGVDFPWLLYNIIKGNEIEEVHEYKTGQRCRWLFPGDILHFISNKSRFKMNPPFFSRIKDDIAWFRDPMPVIGFILACFRYLFDKRMWKMMFRR